MALQVWLPLNGDVHNQGLYNGLKFTNQTAVVSHSGYMGDCYYFSATTGAGIYHTDLSDFLPRFTNGNSFSFSFFFNTSAGTMSPAVSLSYNVRCFVGTSTSFNMFLPSSGGSGNYSKYVHAGNYNDGKWHHYAASYNSATNDMDIYIDGEHKSNAKWAWDAAGTPYSYNPSWTNYFALGRDVNSSTADYSRFYNGSLNDVRFYDHCLSQREVKELSKGLMLHYRFSGPDIEGNGNMVRNGWGGIDNWYSTGSDYVSYTEIPNDSGVTCSYGPGENYTLDYIPIVQNHRYQISSYFKYYTRSPMYFSIISYDVDKKEIYHYNSRQGFKTATTTTLARNLTSGDTVVYIENASNWITSGSNNEYIAIFGYQDSTGYVYPDLVYTRNCLRITKENINKTANTIPLLNAYTGTTVPCGTTVVQSTAGATYYYPLSFTSAVTGTEWFYHSGATFVPSATTRLYAARYFRIFKMSAQYMAGITLRDLDAGNVIYDSSGYRHDMEIFGNVGVVGDAPRAENSVFINDGRYNFLSTEVRMPMYSITMSCWMKGGDEGFGMFGIPMAANLPYEVSIASGGKFRNGFYVNGTRSVFTTNSKNVLDGEWHMLTATFDGTKIRRYVDGEFVTGSERVAEGTLNGANTYLSIGTLNASNPTNYASKNMYVADARVYASALTDEDIRELYNMGASIDNKGNLFTYELKEN